jgi:hypothetical protein
MGPITKAFWASYFALKRDVTRAFTFDPKVVGGLVEKRFPQGYEEALAEANAEGQALREEIRDNIRRGVFLW